MFIYPRPSLKCTSDTDIVIFILTLSHFVIDTYLQIINNKSNLLSRHVEQQIHNLQWIMGNDLDHYDVNRTGGFFFSPIDPQMNSILPEILIYLINSLRNPYCGY